MGRCNCGNGTCQCSVSITAGQYLTVTGIGSAGDPFVLSGGAAWTAYTPTNSNITVGNGTQAAAYMRFGRMIVVRYSLLWGSTTSFGGNVAIGLPVAAIATLHMPGPVELLDNGTRFFVGVAIVNDASTVLATIAHSESGNSGIVNATNPFTWVTADRLVAQLTYESAA